MQDNFEKYSEILEIVQQNFSVAIDKIYARQNMPISNEVKEVQFLQEKSTPQNTTFQINEILTNLEKIIVFVENEKADILYKKKKDIEPEDNLQENNELTEVEMEILADIMKKRIKEQDDYIQKIKDLTTNLRSLRDAYLT